MGVIAAVRDKVNDEYPQLDVEFIQTLQDQSATSPVRLNL